MRAKKSFPIPAFLFRDFPILEVQFFYDICCVHIASDIIRKLKKVTSNHKIPN